ncbi:DUF6056 family protein [Hymenobacter negativus]|uniref:Glycosyltransferase RgtA/B/C/D-like domain-containing protein n=1 Tax=Hymenobacter negativus TaxID=2795026 RepID=A0ABS3QB55_9BACT|nr:DUF6056 family protein [Hymenobacter negativus]MBO2008495.1 hypothetical protein [Hymenobacter negativus]
MSSSTSLVTRFFQRHQNLLTTISVVLVALPFVALSYYNHPSLDDFLDAVTVQRLGFWESQKYFYLNHTGRYATTVLLALVNPLLYGHMEGHWWIVALGFILGTFFTFRLCITLLPGVSGRAAWLGASILLAMWLAYAPGQAEGLYWFTGAYTYVVTGWLLLLWLVCLGHYAIARQAKRSTAGWLICLVILTVAIAGSTEPVALPFLLILLAYGMLSWWHNRSWVLLLMAGLTAVGCIVSFSAPGNFVRMQSMDESFGLIKALAYSLFTTAYLLLTWIGNPVLLALSALILPVLYRAAQQREHLLVAVLARFPAGWLTIGLGLLLAAANCPAYYASGTGLPLRARTTLYMLFLVAWFGVLLAWCCRQIRQGQPSGLLQELATGRLAPLWVSLLVLFFFADYNVQTRRHLLGFGSNNVLRAYQQWLDGEAARYDAELRTRYQTMKTGGPVVVIHPLRNKPELLFSFGVADVGSREALNGYGQYFGVPRIVVAKDSL